MAYRKILTGIIAAAAATSAVACAQDGPHSHPATDAANAGQDAEIAKALSADALIVEGMADLDRRLDALEAATAGLSSSTADLDARVKALEDATPPDPKPLPSVSINAAPSSAPEGASFVLTLARTGDLSTASSVAYGASGAADAADFAGGVIPSGVVSFAAGDAAAQVSVKTVDDTAVEPDEAFSVTLSNPVGATLGQASASAIILNNDVATPPPPPTAATIAIDRAARFQTVSGWEVTGRLWEQNKTEDRYDASWLADRAEIINDLVNEAGVNRLRLELQSGAENPVDYWSRFVAGQDGYTAFSANYYNNINDNADPASANAGGFQWSQLDYKVDNILLPMRAALAARGEALYVNLNVVDFGNGTLGSLDISANPAEYAELVTEAFKHLKAKYAITPDALEITLEPEQGSAWTGAEIGAAIKAATARLAAAGFAPKIIAPSTMKASNAVPYYDAAVAAGGSADMIAFHTYGTTDDATIAAIAARAKAAGIETGMLEKTGADVNQLYRDLTIGNVSAWQQWAIAHKIDSGAYLLFADPAAPAGARITLASRTRALAQIWRHVRAGDVRVGAATADAGLKPLAFVRADGGVKVAVITTRGRSFSVGGLPAGAYRAEYTTASALSVDAGKVTVGADGVLPLSIPEAGVVAAYPDKATAPPPPPPPQTGALFPNTNDGKPIAQLGVGHHIYWQAENPYKNLRLLYPEYGGGAKVAAGEADPTTGWIYMKPGETLVLGRVRPAQANGINTDPGEYVLKASIRQGSTADITALGFVANGGDATTIRKTAFLDDQDLNGNEVKLNGGASGGWIKVDFWGPTKWENDPLGWHPDFLKDASRYKIIRFLDWTTTNGSSVTNAAEWIDDSDYTIYNNSNNGQKPLAANGHLRKFGYAYGRMFDLANKADAAVHVNIPLAMGASVIKTELLDCRQSIVKPAVVANFAAIEASAKVEYLLLAEKMARSAVAQNYPNDKVILIELANEVWNYGNSAFACTSGYADGLGMALNGGTDYDAGTGLGHMAVIAFDAFEKAFAQIKPGQEVKYVLGVQTMGSTARAKKAAAEFDRYAPTVGVDPKLRQKIFLATTNYFSGGWQWNKNRSPGAGNNPFGVSDEGAFNAAFMAADADGSLFAKLKAWYLGPLSANVNVARLKTQTTMWRDYAVNNGWRSIINYEGSPADMVGSLPADPAKSRPYDQLGVAYPQSAQVWKTWIRAQEAFDVQDAYLAMLTSIDTSNSKITDGGWLPSRLVVANYILTGRDPNYGSPWTEKNPLEAGQCPPEGFIGAWCKYLRQ